MVSSVLNQPSGADSIGPNAIDEPTHNPGCGGTYARAIQSGQSHAVFSHEVAWVGEMIQADATRILELLGQMKALEAKIDAVAQESSVASILVVVK
jgi:hypothetical protein